MTVRYDDTCHPCLILCQVKGSVWRQVLPYCALNCGMTFLFAYLAENNILELGKVMNPQGHGIVGLLVSFLVINKMYLALDRYMLAISLLGQAFSTLRELCQLASVFATSSAAKIPPNNDQPPNNIPRSSQGGASDTVSTWQGRVRDRVIDVLECTVRVLQDDKKALYLARNEFVDSQGFLSCCTPSSGTKDELGSFIFLEDDETSSKVGSPGMRKYDRDDPMMFIQALRTQLYNDSFGSVPSSVVNTGAVVHEARPELELLERCKLIDLVHEFSCSYRELLRLVSTPLPFPMIQMGRTFLFLWMFSMPLALAGHDFHLIAVNIFVFFLTYGYVGLELVSIELLYPFGDGVNSLNISGMKDATIRGIVKDSTVLSESFLRLSQNQKNRGSFSTTTTTTAGEHYRPVGNRNGVHPGKETTANQYDHHLNPADGGYYHA